MLDKAEDRRANHSERELDNIEEAIRGVRYFPIAAGSDTLEPGFSGDGE